jgi:hypothetical protein
MTLLVEVLAAALVIYSFGFCLGVTVLAVRSAARSFTCGYARGREMRNARKAGRKAPKNLQMRTSSIDDPT